MGSTGAPFQGIPGHLQGYLIGTAVSTPLKEFQELIFNSACILGRVLPNMWLVRLGAATCLRSPSGSSINSMSVCTSRAISIEFSGVGAFLDVPDSFKRIFFGYGF